MSAAYDYSAPDGGRFAGNKRRGRAAASQARIVYLDEQRLGRPRSAKPKVEERAVKSVARILDSGQPTKFVFEAACRHGIRAGFCLDGVPWSRADLKAATIVDEALRRLGAARPTWFEGQPEYADTDASYGSCANTACQKPIPEERVPATGRQIKYCSNICADAVHQQKVRRDGYQYTLAEWLAECAARSQQTLEARARDCAHCNRPFLSRVLNAKYCSHRCFTNALRAGPRWRTCSNCGEEFERQRPAKYCSIQCAASDREKKRRRGELPRPQPFAQARF